MNKLISDVRGEAAAYWALAVAAVVALIALAMWILPNYNVWQQNLAGQAELARAEQNRQIRIQEAEAELAASKLDAQSEVERARGVAEANEIIADGLGGPEGYLRYLWITQLSKNGQNVVYVPTETGLPILEAGRTPPLE